MIELTDENVQWLSVDGAKVSVETEGKTALRESMGRYFRGCPSCKSSLEWIQSAGSRVTAMEHASWTGKGGAKSQRSLSVYEFRGGKIMRVYYFPEVSESGLSALRKSFNRGGNSSPFIRKIGYLGSLSPARLIRALDCH